MPPLPHAPAGPPREPGWDHVAARAARDADFRRALLDDPAGALRQWLGITLPPGYRVRFVERPRDLDALVVLPEPEGDDELSEHELDQAAGGDGTWSDDPPPPPPPPSPITTP